MRLGSSPSAAQSLSPHQPSPGASSKLDGSLPMHSAKYSEQKPSCGKCCGVVFMLESRGHDFPFHRFLFRRFLFHHFPLPRGMVRVRG